MFYDLNLPVDGASDLARREVLAMALQLGYTGVAADHMVTGVMSDTDRCRIKPLELPTILAAADGMAESVRFHRKLLGVPQKEPFRQFSRITVVLETQTQANLVTSTNPVLRSYDLVAVRPTNSKMFAAACSYLEVDIISLDLTQKQPLRLKSALVRTAVERGIYFEICYSKALSDPRGRRDLFVNTMTLHDGTRGRNIIVCSGARRSSELRGPNDVANMSTLFGFSLEAAKNAISRTCKSLLLHGSTRQTYKSAVHVARVVPPSNTNGGFDVPADWDHLTLNGASADLIPPAETKVKTSTSDKALSEEAKMKVFTAGLDGFLESGGVQLNSLSTVSVLAEPGGTPVSRLVDTSKQNRQKRQKGGIEVAERGQTNKPKRLKKKK